MCIIKVENNNICLEANVLKMGNDLLVSVTGGNKPHIGCVSVTLPRPSSYNPKNVSATTSTINLPGHKDDVVANYIADAVCKKVNATVVVACGIHIDAIQPEEIDIIKNLTLILANKIIDSLNK